jgi:transcriptional regulator with XRE-family HTH domain
MTLDGRPMETTSETANSENLVPQQKTPQRLQYEAQVDVIKHQIGELEFIRAQLGLSQRKISQLLLVDPSSWNRWINEPDKIPPVIWRALQWYLALNNKIPGLNTQYFLSQNNHSILNKTIKDLQEKQSEVELIEQNFLNSIEKLKFDNHHQQDQLQKQQRHLRFAYALLFLIGLFNVGVFILTF